MDLRSLNSGSVETKQWLNPVVGDLKAKSVSASSYQVTDEDSNDTVQLSGGIYRRAAGSSPSFIVNPITPPGFGPGMVEIANSQTNEGDIPINALVPGCSYELYFSGKVVDASVATSGLIIFYPCFQATQPTDYPECMTEIATDFAATGDPQGFETRLIFRVVATTDTTMQLECSFTTSWNSGTADPAQAQFRQFTNTGSLPMTTPSRAASVTKRFPFTIWAKSQGGPYTLTRTQLYLRRLS